jgi:hypothetical protein
VTCDATERLREGLVVVRPNRLPIVGFVQGATDTPWRAKTEYFDENNGIFGANFTAHSFQRSRRSEKSETGHHIILIEKMV